MGFLVFPAFPIAINFLLEQDLHFTPPIGISGEKNYLPPWFTDKHREFPIEQPHSFPSQELIPDRNTTQLPDQADCAHCALLSCQSSSTEPPVCSGTAEIKDKEASQSPPSEPSVPGGSGRALPLQDPRAFSLLSFLPCHPYHSESSLGLDHSGAGATNDLRSQTEHCRNYTRGAFSFQVFSTPWK